MLTFTGLHTRCADLSRDTTTESGFTAPATIFKEMINETQHLILDNYRWPFLEKTQNITSVADQSSYSYQVDTGRIMALRMAASSTVFHIARPVESDAAWERLEQRNEASSNVTKYFKRAEQEGKVYVHPAPASSSLTMRLRYRIRVPDMTQADYTTGTIVTTTNGGTGVVGTGTPNWVGGLSPEATLHIRITKTASDSAKSGDGWWYELSSITDDTNIVLLKNYEGTSIASATAAYTISELPLVPEGYEALLYYRPLALYFMQNAEDMTQADRFWAMYDGGYERGLSPRVSGMLGRMLTRYITKTADGVYVAPDEIDLQDIQDFRIDTIIGESW